MPQPLTWPDLRRIGATYEDLQQTRIRAANRRDAGLRSGLSVIADEAIIDALEHVEHDTGLTLRRAFRHVAPPSVIEWQKATLGIGEHLLARLLGHIGHPAIAAPHHWEGEGSARVLVVDEPHARTVAQLWAYCGHGDATRRKVKGATAEDLFAAGNPRAKMLVHLIAECCMKNRRSPYRMIYDDARDEYADREGWTLGHQHAAALRLVGKEVLRDLWTVAASGEMAVAA